MYFLGGPLPPAAGLLRRAHGGRGAGAASGCVELRPAAGALGRRSPAVTTPTRGGARCGRSSSPRCATTSTRPRRWRRCSSWSARATAGSAAGSRCRARPPLRRDAARARPREPARTAPSEVDEEALRLADEREEARRARDFDRADAVRDELLGSAAGRCATRPRGRCWSRAGVDPLRPQRRAGGAAGPPAGAQRVGGGRALAPRHVRGAPESGAGRRARRSSSDLCGSPDHQGLVVRGRALSVRRRRAAARSPSSALVVALDQVQDPQNLGAVCRSAECAGATGVVMPERRAAEVTPAVCRASAGAVEHLRVARVRNLADFLARGQAARARGSTAPRPERRAPYTDVDWTGPGRDRAGLGGRGPAAARPRRPATSWSRCPSGAGSIPERVAAAAAVLLYEAASDLVQAIGARDS